MPFIYLDESGSTENNLTDPYLITKKRSGQGDESRPRIRFEAHWSLTKPTTPSPACQLKSSRFSQSSIFHTPSCHLTALPPANACNNSTSPDCSLRNSDGIGTRPPRLSPLPARTSPSRPSPTSAASSSGTARRHRAESSRTPHSAAASNARRPRRPTNISSSSPTPRRRSRSGSGSGANRANPCACARRCGVQASPPQSLSASICGLTSEIFSEWHLSSNKLPQNA